MTDYARYDRVAIALHWLMALAIIFMLLLGFFMEDFKPLSFRIAAYQFHKSLGLTILALAVVRLVWRLTHPAPPYPAHMKRWEVLAAEFAHGLLYSFMIIMPLTGWIIISTSSNKFPTHFFGTFQIPLIGGFGDNPKPQHELAEELHEWLAIGAIALLVAHAGAALKHHLFERDSVLLRMMPRFLTPLLTRRS